MTKSILKKCAVVLVAAACTIPASAAMAQAAGYIYGFPYAPGTMGVPKNGTATPSPQVLVGPAQGPTGSPLQIRTNGNLGATPLFVSFSTGPNGTGYGGGTIRLSGSGTVYTAPVPRELCSYGRRTFYTHVRLTNGFTYNNVGMFTPTNCSR